MIATLTENLFLSGMFDISNLDDMNKLGITAILNVGYEVNDPIYENILMIKIGIYEFQPNLNYMKELAVSTLDTLLENSNKVLIHCKHGAHRSPYIAFTYLSQKTGKTLDDIYKEFIPKVPWGIIYPPSIK